MPQTQRVPAPRQNHRFPDSVAIDQLASQLTATALGARKQTSAPKGPGEEQLRKDVARNRNRCFASILRLAFADLRDGESIEDVTAALYEAIDMLTVYAGPDSELAFKACVEIESCIQCDEDKLTVAVLCGDDSEPTVVALDRALGRHARAIADVRSSLHQRRYGPRRVA